MPFCKGGLRKTVKILKNALTNSLAHTHSSGEKDSITLQILHLILLFPPCNQDFIQQIQLIEEFFCSFVFTLQHLHQLPAQEAVSEPLTILQIRLDQQMRTCSIHRSTYTDTFVILEYLPLTNFRRTNSLMAYWKVVLKRRVKELCRKQ